MATPGCTNPRAKNYNPGADQDDGSCIYLSQVAGTCYAFQDVNPTQLEDRSFTLSLSILDNSWVFYHDYIPDFYINTREKMYLLKDNKIYKANAGEPGKYFDNVPRPMFIDVVFQNDQDMVLNTVEWITEVLQLNNAPKEDETLTHITVWNNYQCTGRVSLAQIFEDLQYENMRQTQGKWSFNNFRDLVKTRGVQFLESIFKNYSVKSTELDPNMPWYDKKLLEDKYFIIRFEFDNSQPRRIFVHDVNISADQAVR